MSRLQFARPGPAEQEAEDQHEQRPVEFDEGENGAASHGNQEIVEGLERRFADAETRFADAQTKLDRRAEELAGQLAEATRREEEARKRAEGVEHDLEAERLRREREQELRAQTSRRVGELTAAVEAARRDLGAPTEARPQGPTAPAGWYPDPSGEATLRYWDGEAWTDWTDDRWFRANQPSEAASDELTAEPQEADQSNT